MSADLEIPPTTIPCPDWCTDPAGHGFPSTEVGDPTILVRYHTRHVEDVTTGRGTNAASVVVDAEETARGDVSLGVAPSSICIYGYHEGDDMTGPMAVRLATALLNAADQWDRITGGLVP